jgi:hypothetical protein
MLTLRALMRGVVGVDWAIAVFSGLGVHRAFIAEPWLALRHWLLGLLLSSTALSSTGQ